MHTPKSLLLALACTFLACGGDSGPDSVDSGLPAERKGSELSDTEADQICKARAEYGATLIDEDEAKRVACVFSGLLFSEGNAETCQMFVDMCVNEEFEEGEGGEGGECYLDFELSTCDATVSEIEACLTEKDRDAAAAAKSLTCSSAFGGEGMEPQAGPACSAAQVKCPGIFVAVTPDA